MDDAISVIWFHWLHDQKSYTLFEQSWPNEINAAIENAPVYCDAGTGTNSITWPKESYQALFQLSSPNEEYTVIDNAFSIKWQQCWY